MNKKKMSGSLIVPKDNSKVEDSGLIKRRKFLGMGLVGVAGLSLPLSADAGLEHSVENLVNESVALLPCRGGSLTNS